MAVIDRAPGPPSTPLCGRLVEASDHHHRTTSQLYKASTQSHGPTPRGARQRTPANPCPRGRPGPFRPFRTFHLSYRLLRLVRTRLLNFSKILVAATKTPPSHTPPPPLLSLASAARAPSCYLPPWRNIVDPAPHQVRGGDHPRATRRGHHPPLLPPANQPTNHPTTTTLLSSLHLLHPRVAPT